ncbi:unnamed protein product [Hymenolepis diminuta]|uniref:NADH dehydrogenase [ubiquinone] 1 alpha subcomplex subunit 7 n=1 Tax=Hymenolepis diminuta TaxID=6216 RepID=A0A0R3SAT1_HYMDI|nr:unnamed protein product [Hymenolepis diminuta]VUZ57828.1 unnamed protein product [Hymenolepis diminuta]
MAANRPKQTFATLKNVLRSNSRKWADTAAPRPTISAKDLREHYAALFKRRGEKVELPDFSDLKQDTDLAMDELFKAKTMLKTGKSSSPNGPGSELLKWGRSPLDCHMLDMFNLFAAAIQRSPENGLTLRWCQYKRERALQKRPTIIETSPC